MNNKFSGMTVNERLYMSGLMDEFDKAVRERNVSAVKVILKEIEINDKNNVNAILKNLGLDDDFAI